MNMFHTNTHTFTPDRRTTRCKGGGHSGLGQCLLQAIDGRNTCLYHMCSKCDGVKPSSASQCPGCECDAGDDVLMSILRNTRPSPPSKPILFILEQRRADTSRPVPPTPAGPPTLPHRLYPSRTRANLRLARSAAEAIAEFRKQS